MKLKNRDLTAAEQRLAADPDPLQQNRIVRVTLLAIVALGVAALVWMAVYLICLSSPHQDDPAAAAMRTWRTIH